MDLNHEQLAVLSAIGQLQIEGKEAPYTLLQITRKTPSISLDRLFWGYEKTQLVCDILVELDSLSVILVRLGRDKDFGKMLVYPL